MSPIESESERDARIEAALGRVSEEEAFAAREKPLRPAPIEVGRPPAKGLERVGSDPELQPQSASSDISLRVSRENWELAGSPTTPTSPGFDEHDLDENGVPRRRSVRFSLNANSMSFPAIPGSPAFTDDPHQSPPEGYRAPPPAPAPAAPAPEECFDIFVMEDGDEYEKDSLPSLCGVMDAIGCADTRRPPVSPRRPI